MIGEHSERYRQAPQPETQRQGREKGKKENTKKENLKNRKSEEHASVGAATGANRTPNTTKHYYGDDFCYMQKTLVFIGSNAHGPSAKAKK